MWICRAEHVQRLCWLNKLTMRTKILSSSVAFNGLLQFQVIVRNIPRISSHLTSETVDEFFRRNHPDHYLGQQVHGLLLHLGLIHLVHSTRFWTNHKLWLLRNVVIKKATLLFIVSLFTTQIDMLNLWRKGRGFKTGWITISWSLKGILRKDQLDG